MYTSNGVVSAVEERSVNARPDPDLILFGVPGDFRGYVPGYSRMATASSRRFTWAVLEAHTQNRGGAVTLRTRTPATSPRSTSSTSTRGPPPTGPTPRTCSR